MAFIDQPTEAALKDWRWGSVQAERMVATLLHSEGFQRVDPQSPLGGPDGTKDVLFTLNGWKYEKEERIFVTRGNYAQVKVRELICGSKMSDQDFGFIRDLVALINKDIQIDRVK